MATKKQETQETVTADALKAERDALIRDIIGMMRDARLKLAELSGVEQELWSLYRYRSYDIFGELPVAVERLFTQQAYLTKCRAYFDIPPKPDKRESLIASAESQLASIRAILKSVKQQQSRSFSAKSGAPGVTAEDIERLEEREQDAIEALERARGSLAEYQDKQRAEAQEKREAERAEAQESIASYQRGWRAYAQKLRDNTSS